MDTTLHWLTTAFDGLVAFLPNLIAGLIILLVGYIVAKILGAVTSRLAQRFGFESLVERMGLADPVNQARSSHWLGRAVFLVVMFAAVLQASRVWRLDFVAVGMAEIVSYLPHVIGAAFILGVALYAGNWARSRIFRTSSERIGSIRVLPSVVRGAILAVGTFMALRELQIAPEIVNAAFIILLGAAGIAGAIAFGLGGRDVAGRIASSWYDRRRSGEASRTVLGVPDVGHPAE